MKIVLFLMFPYLIRTIIFNDRLVLNFLTIRIIFLQQIIIISLILFHWSASCYWWPIYLLTTNLFQLQHLVTLLFSQLNYVQLVFKLSITGLRAFMFTAILLLIYFQNIIYLQYIRCLLTCRQWRYTLFLLRFSI